MAEHDASYHDAGQLTVLIVEDNDDLRGMLTEIVSNAGHLAIPAASAEEGLEQLPLWTFEVALLDHNLPGIGGLVVGEYLRRNNSEMTIALVTGSDDHGLRRRSEDLSIRFVAKPFEAEEILEVLRGHLARRAASEADAESRAHPDFAPHFAAQLDAVAESFSMPGLPSRIEGRLVDGTKAALHRLRAGSANFETDRIIALSGLLAARLLRVAMPKNRDAETLFAEYDALMIEAGRRPEFGAATGSDE